MVENQCQSHQSSPQRQERLEHLDKEVDAVLQLIQRADTEVSPGQSKEIYHPKLPPPRSGAARPAKVSLRKKARAESRIPGRRARTAPGPDSACRAAVRSESRTPTGRAGRRLSAAPTAASVT